MSASHLQWLALLVLLAVGGCGQGSPVSAPPPQTRDVVDPAIAALEAELGDSLAAPSEPDEDIERAIAGLLPFAARSQGAERSQALADFAGFGSGVLPALEAVASDHEAPAAHREAALEALWTVARLELGEALGPEGEPQLVDPSIPQLAEPTARLIQACAAIERSLRLEREPWLRARAGWYLGRLGLDRSIPELVLRLRYETDHEAVIWLAFALSRFANYSGMPGLENIAQLAAGTPNGELAASMAASIAKQAGADSPAAITWAWEHGDPEQILPRPVRSSHHDLVLWQWIYRFDEFQLRGVDDARFMFERLDEHAALLLTEALYDDSRYVRLHVAQCLARLGRRATVAGPALQEMLREPTIAATAAQALGEIGFPTAREDLEQRLGDQHNLELRVAAARALGPMGDPESIPRLVAIFDQDPASPELAQALAESLAYLRDPTRAVPGLMAAVANPLLEPSTSRAALRFLLEQALAAGRPEAERWLGDFDAAEGRTLPAGLESFLLP